MELIRINDPRVGRRIKSLHVTDQKTTRRHRHLHWDGRERRRHILDPLLLRFLVV